MTNFYLGTSNMVLPVPNKTFFPPQYQDKSRLTYYASLFNSVEINASFYKMPIARMVAKWSNEVPDNFRFSFKMLKDVTHTGSQAFNLPHVPEFMSRINATEKRGCLLVQLPPKFGKDIFQLGQLIAETQGGWPLAVEFRNNSWYIDDVFELLYESGTAMVIHDMAKSKPPLEITSDKLVYLRFHGPEGRYRGSYDDGFLEEYASYILEWLEEGKEVYAYFNNTMGSAVENLQTLNRFVSAQ